MNLGLEFYNYYARRSVGKMPTERDNLGLILDNGETIL